MDPDDDNLTAYNTTQEYYNRSSDGYYFYYYKNILPKTSITLYSIVFALGIIGNGLVIWIAGFRMKDTVSAVWFLHLAIADFLCCASLPLRIYEWAVYYSFFSYGHFSIIANCRANMFLFNINMTSSVLLLTAMSIDRWVSVMWPFWAKAHRTCNVVRISAAIIWGLSLIVAGVLYYVYIYHVGEEYEWCVYDIKLTLFNPELYHTMQLIRFVTMCVIPFLIIVTSYVTIFYKIRKSKRSQRSQRSSRIITAVISCFFICWFPYYIWPLISWDYYIPSPLLHILYIIIVALACVNSCMNPIIYVFMGPGFRQGFFRSIPARVERALREHPNDLCREDTGNSCTTDV
ncbi:C3a anaphylatoxin chemotactic receptor-like isoform X1 [Anomaloglossus baeobatrachus]|uniref:C3a anaphylatoxin chemotactic receptor-like isoform X1 n=1 Tax=Anomaloglossus baeobatrachus TaxID=238106 RepID=UPI003F505CAD